MASVSWMISPCLKIIGSSLPYSTDSLTSRCYFSRVIERKIYVVFIQYISVLCIGVQILAAIVNIIRHKILSLKVCCQAKIQSKKQKKHLGKTR